MGAVWKLLLIATAVYGGLSLGVFLLQGRLLYFPSSAIHATPKAKQLDYQDISFRSEQGTPLHGWYVPYDGAALTVLFMHGNAGNISDRLETLEILHGLKLNTFIFDYPGYGLSEGKPSEQTIYDSAMAAWSFLTIQRKTPANTIVVFGQSLGGGPATWLSTRIKPAGLVLESTFTSVPDRAAEIYPWLPVRWLSRHHYGTLQRLAAIDCPLLVVHSKDDTTIPFAHGESIYAAADEPKSFLEISGSHNDGFLTSGLHYREGLAQFLNTLRQSP